MRIDSVTLSDLEVTRASDGGFGLVGLVDRTQTGRGRAALQKHLRSPPACIESVRAAQEAVRFFAEHPGLFSISDEAVRSVQRFIDSNLAITQKAPWGDRISELAVRLLYRDVYREIRQGVDRTRHLFGSLSRSCERILQQDPPALIRSLAEQLGDAARDVLKAGAEGSLLSADRAYRGSLRKLIVSALDAVAEMDMWCGQGTFAASVAWTYPEFVDSAEFLIDADEVSHPMLKEAVGNPVRLHGGEPMVFLTGPNMAGKTTYLRSVGLLVVLAQAGLPVPASRARLTPVEAVFSSLNPSDNLQAGLSYFMAEVERVRQAAELLANGRRALVLFDEVFKGTNVKDALEASAQVISGFARASGSGFIFSSHLSELADVLSAEGRVRFAHFDGDIESGVPRYPYRLEEGVSDKRFGMVLLRQAHIPELIARLGSSTAA